MSLLEIIQRDPSPEPWVEGDNIPWNEPDSHSGCYESIFPRHTTLPPVDLRLSTGRWSGFIPNYCADYLPGYWTWDVAQGPMPSGWPAWGIPYMELISPPPPSIMPLPQPGGMG